jgi:hypothetical protein
MRASIMPKTCQAKSFKHSSGQLITALKIKSPDPQTHHRLKRSIGNRVSAIPGYRVSRAQFFTQLGYASAWPIGRGRYPRLPYFWTGCSWSTHRLGCLDGETWSSMSMKRQNCDSWRGTKGISAATLVGVTIVEWYLPNPTNGWWIVHTRPTEPALKPPVESHQRSWWMVHTRPTEPALQPPVEFHQLRWRDSGQHGASCYL